MPKSTGPGAYRLFQGYDLLKAYPSFQGVVNSFSLSLELTNFDIGSDWLKTEHNQGIWSLSLKAFDKVFSSANVWGFHSHTGDAKFNLALAERRAENAMSRAKVMLDLDTRSMVRHWGFRGVAWRQGMQGGESPEMRKVLLVFRGLSADAPTTSSASSASSEKLGMKLKLL